MLTVATILTLLIAGAAVYLAVRWFRQLAARDGDEAMEIARTMPAGGKALPEAWSRGLAALALLIFVLLAVGSGERGLGLQTAIAFALGAIAAASAAWFGAHCAMTAAVRTAQAAKTSVAAAFELAFRGGVATAMTAVGLALFGIAGLMLVYQEADANFVRHLLGFALGASTIALFARAGGTFAEAAGGTRADLLDCHVSAIIAAALIGFASGADADHRLRLMLYPVVLAAAGALAAYAGTFAVKGAGDGRLAAALSRGRIVAAVILIVAMAALTPLIGPEPAPPGGGETAGSWHVWLAMVVGLALGTALGKVSEYYTSERMAPAQELAEQSRSAGESVVQGLAAGMASTWLPVILLAMGVWTSHHLAATYGICIAAAGMLATLGISLAADACAALAGQARGIARLLQQDEVVRQRIDAVAAAGNHTSAGRGSAIGASALTALALFAAYQVVVGTPIDLGNGDVLTGLLIGAMLPFLFSSLVIAAAGRVARRRLLATGLVAVIAPLLTGMIFGKAAVAGLLAGALGTGVLLAWFLTDAGLVWNNARKYVEAGHLGGVDGPAHRATVLGDTVGAPLRDDAGPSLTLLVRLMALVSLLALPLFK